LKDQTFKQIHSVATAEADKQNSKSMGSLCRPKCWTLDWLHRDGFAWRLRGSHLRLIGILERLVTDFKMAKTLTIEKNSYQNDNLNKLDYKSEDNKNILK
jgi:hypothetical protein